MYKDNEKLDFIRQVIYSCKNIEQVKSVQAWLIRIAGKTISTPEYNIVEAILHRRLSIFRVDVEYEK